MKEGKRAPEREAEITVEVTNSAKDRVRRKDKKGEGGDQTKKPINPSVIFERYKNRKDMERCSKGWQPSKQ